MVERDRDNLSGDRPHHSDHKVPEVHHISHRPADDDFDAGRRKGQNEVFTQEAGKDNTHRDQQDPGRGRSNDGRR